MKKNKTLIILILGFLVVIFSSCPDKSDQKKPIQPRIISLAPHITEIIFALNAQDNLVAVTDFCKYPPDALKKEKIGGLLDPNVEKMLQLNPTHLFGLPSHQKLNQQLESFGYEITMMPNENIEDVLNSIRIIGEKIGKKENAQRLINRINKSNEKLRKDADPQNPVSAVLLIGRSKDSIHNMTAAGKDTYINELWEMVGGSNIYDDLPTRYGSINLESLLLRNPAVIIEFNMDIEHSVSKSDLGPEWNLLKNIRAVKTGQVYTIGGNHTMIPGPRMVLLGEDFRKIINRVKN
jgi:iron complex transport system substrate-binding protein